MSTISKGTQTSSSSYTVTALLTAATLLITGIATFASGILSHGAITAPSFVATSTTTGLTMQGGGDINASSTNSDATFGGTVSSTNIIFGDTTGTKAYLTGTVASGTRIVLKLGRINTPSVEYVGTGDGCIAVIFNTSTTAPDYQTTSTANCNQ
jgi:hypothetical protein